LTPEVYHYVFTNYTEDELKEFFGCQTGEPLQEERRKYEQGLSMYRKSFFVFQLIEKDSNNVIGWCGYHTWYVLHNRAEIGYLISDEASKRKGYMSEALPAVIEYGFDKMKLHRIEAMLNPDNVASLKLLGAQGFVKEGYLREHYFKDGKPEDSLVMSLLKKEYKSSSEEKMLSNGVLENI
jgi:[ribosomal protein S5]-alanine N-acetyltransferase